MAKRLSRYALAIAAVTVAFDLAFARQLTFEERVRAEAAILKVYHAHTLGSPPPFEQAYSRELLESRVRRYLRQSLLLERRWHTPIGPEALSAEARRIAERTRFPQRLQELYDALERDGFLFEECVARASLADRLTRSFFEGDADRIASKGARSEWDTWWASVEEELDANDVPSASMATMLPQAPSALECSPDDTWLDSSLNANPDVRAYHSAVWTGSLMLLWGGQSGLTTLRSGLRYDPLTDTWSVMSGANVPTSLGGYYDRTAWTGTEMIVWSGSGARYDPITDTWAPMAADGSGYQSVSSVWTGQEFIVCYSIACRRYKPANDTWSSTSNPVSAMYGGQTAVWTGSEMIVFGGRDSTTSKNTGGRYNPQTDTWSAMPTAGAPARAYHTAVWTGTQMIVWGGYESGTQEPELGARYTPATNQWTPLPTSTSPEGRHEHTAVWTGSEMIVWGGRSRETFPEKVFADGGRYDPVNDSWTPIPSLGAASSRYAHSAVWDGARMIVYGGQGPSNLGYRVDGSRYDLASCAWTPVSLGGAPVPRKAFATVWTGSEMIVWGGEEAFPPGQMLNTGARYDPLIDQWTAMSVGAAPQPRKSSSMVWTGTEAIVLGGLLGPGDSNPTSTGGRYSPASDSWAPTSNAGAPSPGSVIWSGSEAIVWNGYTSTGGRYDPSVDQWRPISSSGAPQSASTAVVWTDHEMIVWGGDDVFGGDDGGRYNPASDTWAAVTALGPSPRTPAAASWNGYEMLIWGGYVWLTTDRRQNLYDGGRYNPPTGTWSMVPTQGAPSTGEYMTTVALGREFLVWGPDGYRYAPDVAAPWRAMAAPAVPPPSSAHIVWTGEVALFWDGLYRRGAMYAVDSDHDGDSNACDADDDDDGTPDVSDCAPLDEAAVIEPAEVEDVVMSKMSPNVRFDWTAQPGMSYGLIAGYLSHLAADGSVARADCMLPSTPTNSWSGFLSPASPGDGLYFLVRARNACGVGTYGAATSGNLHISDADCP